MDGVSILEKIVEEEGNCCWASVAICKKCPLGRLARDEKGGFMSCVEALNIEDLSEAEADARYKKAALEKLAGLFVDRMIEGS